MKLSPTERVILSTLEQANGETVSRHAFGLSSESNTLEVLISRLRKKGWDIKSVRGIGYRLVTP